MRLDDIRQNWLAARQSQVDIVGNGSRVWNVSANHVARAFLSQQGSELEPHFEVNTIPHYKIPKLSDLTATELQTIVDLQRQWEAWVAGDTDDLPPSTPAPPGPPGP